MYVIKEFNNLSTFMVEKVIRSLETHKQWMKKKMESLNTGLSQKQQLKSYITPKTLEAKEEVKR